MIEMPRLPAQRWCDNCGRQVQRMHRFHRGKGYCSVCYPSEFPAVPCTGCLGIARMHRRDSSPALCGGCRRARRTCHRCGKPVPKAGLKVGVDAVVCPACAPHFRGEEPCSNCGRLSSRLTWGGEGDLKGRVCQPCRNESTYATCVHCRRYRPAAGLSSEGRAHCSHCGPAGAAWHECPACGMKVSGSGRGQCRHCLNRARLRREARLIAVALSQSWVVALVDGFAEWLIARDSASPKLPKTFISHLPFFQVLDQSIESAERLVPQTMMDEFTVQGLRRHLLPLQFLRHEVGLEITEEMKTDHVETARTIAILERAETGGWGNDLIRFNQWLIQEQKPVRTRRLYVSAADRLMRFTGIKVLTQLDQEMVDRYLTDTPCARNDVGAVLRFAKTVLNLSIGLPVRKFPRPQTPKPLAEVRTLLKKIRGGTEPVQVQHLRRLVSIVMRIPLRAIIKGDWWPEQRGRRWLVVSKREVVACPPELEDVVARWLTAREDYVRPQ